jgi:hypothetical protein
VSSCLAPEHTWTPLRECAIRFCGYCGKVRAWKGHPEGCDCKCHHPEAVKAMGLSRITACGVCGWRQNRKTTKR